MKKIILIFILAFISCNGNIKTELTRLYSKPVNLKINARVLCNSKDSLNFKYYSSIYKLIIYSDTLNCTSCNINSLYKWRDLIEYANTLNGKIKFYFIFYATKNKINELENILQDDRIDYPVLIDENGDFERLNPHLPKNKRMHTFLLDENNKVILVGNPLNNKEIEKLFYKKTQELLSK